MSKTIISKIELFMNGTKALGWDPWVLVRWTQDWQLHCQSWMPPRFGILSLSKIPTMFLHGIQMAIHDNELFCPFYWLLDLLLQGRKILTITTFMLPSFDPLKSIYYLCGIRTVDLFVPKAIKHCSHFIWDTLILF